MSMLKFQDTAYFYAMNSICLKKAATADLALITTMARPIWQQHYVPIIGQEQVDYMLQLMYSPEKLEQQLQDGHVFYLIETDGVMQGYVSVSSKTPGDYFIHKFYLESTGRGKGTGSQVFELLLAELGTVKTIRLTVNRKNFKAVNFYFKTGFRIEEVKDFDIGSGYLMEDFVMLRVS